MFGDKCCKEHVTIFFLDTELRFPQRLQQVFMNNLTYLYREEPTSDFLLRIFLQ